MTVAKVIVDVPASGTNHSFDYTIPDALADVIQKGMRVIVPFGSRTIQGFVTNLEEDASTDYKLKAVADLPDVEPVLTDELIQLGFWLSEETVCLVISAFQAMLPAALKASYKKEIRISPDSSDRLSEELSVLFADGQPVFWDNLVNEHPDLLSSVRRHIRVGSLQVIQHIRNQTAKKTEKVVFPNRSIPVLSQIHDTLDARANKQKQVLSYFIKHEQATSVKSLTVQLGITRSTVKTLVDRGFLQEETREVYRDPYEDRHYYATEPLGLTEEQKSAMGPIQTAIQQEKQETVLLHGVTGSGKTEIYLQAIHRVLKEGREAIVLVPEIALTPQMVERFKGRFGSNVAVMHSGLSQGEKYDEWRKIQRREVQVVVGARSAIFAPFTNLGIIIIDEEHETSYKQEEQPRYHARDVAIYRSSRHHCPVVLGSATPALESYARAQKGVYRLAALKERINQKAMPEVQTIDMRDELRSGNRSMFSSILLEKLKERLYKGEQCLLLLNRRGYSTFMICRDCGYVAECPHCDISLTYHKKHNRLKCHYCGYEQDLPHTCPSCESTYIRFFGTGTQKVEEALNKVLPEARVIRMDVDTTSRKGMHEKHLRRFGEGKADILLGTQMIAKGLDFPNVTLVGVLAADAMLHLPDFRASERTFQLLTQVSGRAGRHERSGQVIIQTYTPQHYSIERVEDHDYLSFFRQEMKERQQHHYPPYYFLALITVTDPDLMKVASTAEKIAAILKKNLSTGAVVLGPVAASIPRVNDRYRYQCMIKYRQEPHLQDIFTRIMAHYGHGHKSDDLKIAVDMNPQILL